MADRIVCCIVQAADKVAAKLIAEAHGDGPGTFSVPLIPNTPENAAVTNPALATHWGMEGAIPVAEVAAFEASVDPMINVTDTDGFQFQAIIASRTPALRVIHEPL